MFQTAVVNAGKADRVDFTEEPQHVTISGENNACVHQGKVRINGCDRVYSLHLQRGADGRWSSRDGVSFSGGDASYSAIKKASRVIPQLLSEALESVENIDELRRLAELECIDRAIDREYRVLKEAQATVRRQQTMVNDLEQKKQRLSEV